MIVLLLFLFYLINLFIIEKLISIVDTEHDARVVAGTVVINHTNRTILLITSSSLRPNKYVLPKGGVEIDERLDYRITAIRETWEEAGVYAASVKCLGPKLNIPSLSSLPPSSTSFSAAVDNSVSSLSPSLVVDPLKKTGKSGKPEKSKTKHKHHKSHTRVKPELHFYELDVNNAKIADTWPEAHKRTRIWETPEEAIAKLKKSKKPELAEVVKMCSLCRSG